MKVTVVAGDLLKQNVDVIVNAWNRNVIPWWLLLPQGVSGAIKKHAGIKPFIELPFKPIPLGAAVITSAGRLNYKAIIHVASINMFWRSTEKAIRDSVINSIRLAEARGFKSIAYPVLGSGSGGFSKTKALEIMQSTLQEVVGTSLQVIIVDYEA